MATKSNLDATLPPVKAEHETPPPQQQPSETTPTVKQQLQQPTNSTNPPTHSPENQQPPHFINSVTELRDLSTFLSAFHCHYDELEEHLNFIRTAIDSKWPKHLHDALIVPLTETPASNTAIAVPVPESANSDQKKVEHVCEMMCSRGLGKHVVSHLSNIGSDQKKVEHLCEMMCSRGLRKHVVSRLSNIGKLREEVTAALKLAPKPAKLVLECLGRFFLQGSRAFSNDPPMIQGREASVLVLECFLLMGCNGIEIEPAVKEAAELAAIAWRKRLINEGGVSNACEIDARGLLLFVGCFGIPGAFKNEDVGDLIRSSNAREISDALRRSNVLLARIPEIIEGMTKNKMEVEAVDATFIFGLEDRFPPQQILTPFLRESKEAWKRERKAAQGSIKLVNEASKKKLADLKSVVKCLEEHKIDPAKLFPGWQIKEKISTLEKDIADLNKKMRETVMPKRKVDETEFKKLKTQEVKRPRFADHGPQQQNVAGHADGKGSYDGLTPINLLDGGLPGHINTYSASSSGLHGFGAGWLPENVIGSVAGSGSSALAAGGGVLRPDSIYGVHSGVLVDKVAQVMNHDGYPYGRRGDVAFHDRLIGHSYAGQPASTGVHGLHGPPLSSSLEGFAGLPNPTPIGASNRSASDLYQFADAVLERESYYSGGSGSRPGAAWRHVVPAHHSSYLY